MSLPDRWQLCVTGDGSHTVFDQEFDAHYHSMHGAITESRHVFLNAGLQSVCQNNQSPRVLEFGFGTGLNAYLTALEADRLELSIRYTTVDVCVLPKLIIEQLNYPALLEADPGLFERMHGAPWQKATKVSSQFTLFKHQSDFADFHPLGTYDLVYFDVFGPGTQPHLWQVEILQKLFATMESGGILVTYGAQGQFKRNLKSTGFVVESIPGPPGKRQMTRAIKPA